MTNTGVIGIRSLDALVYRGTGLEAILLDEYQAHELAAPPCHGPQVMRRALGVTSNYG